MLKRAVRARRQLENQLQYNECIGAPETDYTRNNHIPDGLRKQVEHVVLDCLYDSFKQAFLHDAEDVGGVTSNDAERMRGGTIEAIRAQVADYIERNAEDITDKIGDTLPDDAGTSLAGRAHAIRRGSAQGSVLEFHVLAEICQARVCVYDADRTRASGVINRCGHTPVYMLYDGRRRHWMRLCSTSNIMLPDQYQPMPDLPMGIYKKGNGYGSSEHWGTWEEAAQGHSQDGRQKSVKPITASPGGRRTPASKRGLLPSRSRSTPQDGTTPATVNEGEMSTGVERGRDQHGVGGATADSQNR